MTLPPVASSAQELGHRREQARVERQAVVRRHRGLHEVVMGGKVTLALTRHLCRWHGESSMEYTGAHVNL